MSGLSGLVVADIDHHIIDGINLAGLVLGILGSLFFTYDLLGRPGGPLRIFLRVFLPALLGTLILGGIALALASATEQDAADSASVVTASALIFAACGAILGTFNGLFVDAPNEGEKRRFFYSLRDAGVGFVVIFVSFMLAFALYDLILHFDLSTVFDPQLLIPTLSAAAVGGIVAGIWRFLNRSRPQARPRPRLFSLRGLLIGLVTGLLFPSVALITFFAASGGLDGDIILGAILAAGITGIPGGGITGGISRYMFWWANSLPPRGLEIIGVLLILLGFVAQAVQPFLSIFDLAVAR